MILLEQHSSQRTPWYGLVYLKGTKRKMWILHLTKIKVHLLTGTILAVSCEMDCICSLLHNRVQIRSLIFFLQSSKSDSDSIAELQSLSLRSATVTSMSNSYMCIEVYIASLK